MNLLAGYPGEAFSPSNVGFPPLQNEEIVTVPLSLGYPRLELVNIPKALSRKAWHTVGVVECQPLYL